MQQQVPDKELLEAPTGGIGATCKSCAHCPWMAMNGLESIYKALTCDVSQNSLHHIEVGESVREGALISLNRMLNFSAQLKANPNTSV